MIKKFLLTLAAKLVAKDAYDKAKTLINRLLKNVEIEPLKKRFIQSFYDSLEHSTQNFQGIRKTYATEIREKVKQDEDKFFSILLNTAASSDDILYSLEDKSFQKQVVERFTIEYEIKSEYYALPIIEDCFNYYLPAFISYASEDEMRIAILKQTFKINYVIEILKEIDEKLLSKGDFERICSILNEQTYEVKNVSKKVDELQRIVVEGNDTEAVIRIAKELLNYTDDLLKKLNIIQASNLLERIKNIVLDRADKQGKLRNIKYEIFTMESFIYFSMDKYAESANSNISAYRLKPEDFDAIYNAMEGYLILGIREKAEKLAEKLMQKDDVNPKAYAASIAISPNTSNLDELINKVPVVFRSNLHIADQMTKLALQQRDIFHFQKWAKIAIQVGGNNTAKIYLANSILQEFSHSSKISEIQIDKKRNELEEALKLYNDVWNDYEGTELAQFKSYIIQERSFVKYLLGQFEEAIADINTAIGIEEAPLYLKAKAQYHLRFQEFDKAILLYERLMEQNAFPETYWLLAQAYSATNQLEKAIKTIENSLNKISDDVIKSEAIDLLLKLYINTNKTIEAESLVSQILSEKRNITNLTQASMVYLFLKNDIDEANQYTTEAFNNITDLTTEKEHIQLAQNLFSLNRFGEYIEIFEKIGDSNSYNDLTYSYVRSLIETNRKREALGLCKNS